MSAFRQTAANWFGLLSTVIILSLATLVSPFKSKCRLEAENAALRYQLIVLPRKVRGRIRLSLPKMSSGNHPAPYKVQIPCPCVQIPCSVE